MTAPWRPEYALERGDGLFSPRNPIVPVTLDPAAAEVTFDRSGLAFSLTGGLSAASAGELVADRLFFGGVARDTDAWVTPTAGGVEIFHQIRSAESPEQIELVFDLPAGASLRLAGGGIGDGGAEIVRDGKTLATISPPVVVDSDGERVPVTTAVRTNRLLISVAHRAGDYLYPILVDPQITEYSYWADSGTGLGQRGWNGYTPAWSKWDLSLGETWFWGPGLYIKSKPLYYAHGEYAEWYLNPHRSGIYFPRADLQTSHAPDSTCLFWGIWQNGVGYAGSSYAQRCDSYDGYWSTSCVVSSCDWNYGPEGGPAVYGVLMNQSGQRTSEAFANLRRVAVYLWDRTPPSVAGVSGFGTRPWARDDSVTISGAATDSGGIGMQKVEIRAPGTSWAGRTNNAPACNGTRFSPCSESTGASATISTTEAGLAGVEGVIPVDVTATEYIGRTATKRLGELRVDRTGPQITLSGSVLTAVQSQGRYYLTDNDQQVTITAQDRTPSGGQASGTARIEAYAGGELVFAKDCSGDCSGTMTVDALAWDLAGQFDLTIRARDVLGNESSENVPLWLEPDSADKASLSDDGSGESYQISEGSACEPDPDPGPEGQYCASDDAAIPVATAANAEPAVGVPRLLLTGPPGIAASATPSAQLGTSGSGWGLADNYYDSSADPTAQISRLYDDPRFKNHQLGVASLRRIIPWDLVTRGTADRLYGCTSPLTGGTYIVNAARDTRLLANVDAWVARAANDGYEVVLSIERSHARDAGCYLPTEREYEDAVRQILQRYPYVKLFTAWNEPNHPAQPTSRARVRSHSGLWRAGRFWRRLSALCKNLRDGGCKVAAGEFWDGDRAFRTSASAKRTVEDYRDGTGTRPSIWAWHAYFAGRRPNQPRFRNFVDATGGAASGPRIWLTEQGGEVDKARKDLPNGTPQQWEDRADDALRHILELPSSTPRITRLYVYHWQSDGVVGHHDSGLLRADDNIRQMYCTYWEKVNGASCPYSVSSAPNP